MEATLPDAIDRRIGARLKGLRSGRSWSLDELARRSKVSRATLSRLENGEVSATASVLGRIAAAFGLTISRLMHMVEDRYTPVIHRGVQAVWSDPASGFQRRTVSPPARDLAGEVLECTLAPSTRIAYDDPPRPGLEHHLLMVEGRLQLTIGSDTHQLEPGDCLRYRLFGPAVFATPARTKARYLLFIV
ncbi:MAG TPA: XRE family transcriptional regulator [Aestuariivirgaceae bacterium]|nr:XRE family transcriptional regulator [Aestuariivirgaceae bacterium]